MSTSSRECSSGYDLFSTLPEDLLFHIASNLSVNDLLQLSLTCKILHSLLLERAVWREFVEDVLSSIPQPDIQRRISVLTVQELRIHSTRISRADTNLRDEAFEPCVFHRNLDDWLEVELVPGGEYMIALGAHAEVALLDIRTGDYVETWLDEALPGAKITNAQLSLSVSSANDVRLLVIADHEVDSDFNRTLWLLQIDPDRQTIEPLAIDPCSHFADFASAGDDRLVYTWEENDREFATVRAIPADGHSEDSDAEAQFQFPREFRDETLVAIRVLSNDLLCAFVLGTVALFYLPTPQPAMASNLSVPIVLSPFRVFPLRPRWTSFHASPVIHSGGSTRVLNLLAHGHLHTLVASPDVERCSITRDDHSVPLVSHAAVGCNWAIRALPVVSAPPHLSVLSATTPWSYSKESKRAAARLPTHQGSEWSQSMFVLPEGMPAHNAIQSVSFDEWSGRLFIYSWEDEMCSATFIDFR